jgi:hypothetical protein
MKSRAAPTHKHHEVNVPRGFDMRSKLHALAAFHSRQKAQWVLKLVGFRGYVKIFLIGIDPVPPASSSYSTLLYILLKHYRSYKDEIKGQLLLSVTVKHQA